MSDTLLSVSDQEEALSRVYAQAVAAMAGYTTSIPDYDRDSVDLQIRAGGAMRPAIDLQLKATVNLKHSRDGNVHFPLKRRNYDLLRIETQTPRLLMVLELPRDRCEWMTITQSELVLRRRAYWVSLRGREDSTNQTSVTIPIPVENLFDVKSLRDLMEQSRTGRLQ
jgi:hypothetical protein